MENVTLNGKKLKGFDASHFEVKPRIVWHEVIEAESNDEMKTIMAKTDSGQTIKFGVWVESDTWKQIQALQPSFTSPFSAN